MKRTILFFMVVSILFCSSISFSQEQQGVKIENGPTAPSQETVNDTNEVIVPIFGKGKVEVWIYSNYFCEYCRRMPPQYDQTLSELMRNDKITITFIDVPLKQYPASSLYTRYFFYAIKNKMEYDQANRVRRVLYDAALLNITDERELEEHLKKKGITLTKFDAAPSLRNLNQYLKYLTENSKGSVPSVAIRNGSERKIVIGDWPIINVLRTINEDAKRTDWCG